VSHPVQTQVQTPTREIERVERSLKARLEGLAHRIYATEYAVVVEHVKDALSEAFNVDVDNVRVVVLLKSRPSREYRHILVYDEHGEIIEALGELHIYAEVVGSSVYKAYARFDAHFIKMRNACIVIKMRPVEIEVSEGRGDDAG
jgi:hypothetical protein